MRNKAFVPFMAAAVLAAAGTAGTAVLPAMAPITVFATEKITRASVKFEIEEYDEEGYPQITATVPASAHYTCDSPWRESEEEEDDGETKAKTAAEENYVLELSAEDGYAFYMTKADQVKLSGAGAEYVKASRLDNGATLRIIFKLTKLEDVCGPVDQATWNADGTASWTASHNALRYRLTLSRDGQSSKVYYTGGTTYDFKPVMQKAGSYSLRVVPVSRSGYKGDYAEPGDFVVSKEQADAYAAKYAVEKETRAIDGVETGGPGSVEVIYKNTGWKQDDHGWWYQNTDASYIQYDWVESNGNWYFFGSDGYMVTDAVIRWGNDYYYMLPDGRMAVNQAVPDGRKAGADGILTGTMSKAYMDQAIANGEMEPDDTNSGPGFAK